MPTNWLVCVDDTTDGLAQQYVCAGSLFGNKNSWNKFNKEWRKALHREPRIEYFHGKEVHKLTGQFTKFKNKDRYIPPEGMDAACAKREEMRQVIERSDLVAFGVGVLVPEYHRIRNSHPRGKTFMSIDPFSYVLQELIFRTTNEIAGLFGDVRVRFISDSSNRSDEYKRIYADWKKWNPQTAKSMLDLIHEDDKKHYGIQAADVAAAAVNRIYRSYLETGKVPDEYAMSERFWRIERIDEKNLLNILDHQTPRTSENSDQFSVPLA